MRVFHGTTRTAARLIDRDGFRDGAPHYLGLDPDSDEPVDLVGVWVSDVPLDENEGAASEVYYAIDLPAGRFAEYELVQDIGYREACVPAAVLNACPRERFDELPDELLPDMGVT